MIEASHARFDDFTSSAATLVHVRCRKKKLIYCPRLFQRIYLFMPLGPLTQPLVQAAVVACLHARQTPLLRFSECIE